MLGRNALQGGTVSSQLIVLASKISGLASFHGETMNKGCNQSIAHLYVWDLPQAYAEYKQSGTE